MEWRSRSSVGIFLHIPGPQMHSTLTLHARSHRHSCYSTHRGTPHNTRSHWTQLIVCFRDTPNNYFCSFQHKVSPGILLTRSYRALTAVAPSILCAPGYYYATHSNLDTNTEEEEIIWSIFASSACQPRHHQQRKACPGSWLSRS